MKKLKYIPMYPNGGKLPPGKNAAKETLKKYRSQGELQQYGDFEKKDHGDLLQSIPLYDPKDRQKVIAVENYYKGVPGPQYAFPGDWEGARMEKYDINGKTRFAGSELPNESFANGGYFSKLGQGYKNIFNDPGKFLQEKGLTMALGPIGNISDVASKGKFSNWVNEHGTLVGTIGGAAVGAAAGNPLMGAQIGGSIGSTVQGLEEQDDMSKVMDNQQADLDKQLSAQKRLYNYNPNSMSFKNGGYMEETRYNSDLTYYANGGTHETNPNKGIPLGKKGKVEEGEFRYKNYIFSNRF